MPQLHRRHRRSVAETCGGALLHDRRGGVALIFALATVPLMLLIGLAVDFGFIAQARAQLDLAADTAALTAAKTAGSAFNANQADYLRQGSDAGAAWFGIQAGTIADTAVAAPSVSVTASNNTFTAVVSYEAQVSTVFHRLFGVTTVPLANTASAKISADAYVDVQFLLDNSSSMLIAADPAGVALLQTLTFQQANATPAKVTLPADASGLKGFVCAFACHWDPVYQADETKYRDYFGIARKAGIKLRFDVVQYAVATSIALMISNERLPSQFKTGIFTFNNGFSQIYPADKSRTTSSDLQSATVAAKTIVTPVSPATGDTNFPSAMTKLTAQSTKAGDGVSIDTPRKALIIVTDGVQDWGGRTMVPGYARGAGTGVFGGAEGPINAADCSTIKALGYNVYVLYTTYATDKDLVIFNGSLVPYVQSTTGTQYDLTTNLKTCASDPGNYAEASSEAGITAAMLQMLRSAISTGTRLVR